MPIKCNRSNYRGKYIEHLEVMPFDQMHWRQQLMANKFVPALQLHRYFTTINNGVLENWPQALLKLNTT